MKAPILQQVKTVSIPMPSMLRVIDALNEARDLSRALHLALEQSDEDDVGAYQTLLNTITSGMNSACSALVAFKNEDQSCA